jgi:hypothetical protein
VANEQELMVSATSIPNSNFQPPIISAIYPSSTKNKAAERYNNSS